MKAFWTLLILILAILATGIVYMFFGPYDISAMRKDGAMQSWMLSSAMRNSVKNHAKGIDVPPLTDSSLIATGFEHFDEMCVGCHGAPGIPRSEVGRGLNPGAPDLPKTTVEWKDAELFWIVKNGIKMTGMPAFGTTHSDKQIWAIVSFVRQLGKMTPEQYDTLAKAQSEEGNKH